MSIPVDIQDVLEQYGIGAVTDLQKDTRGFVNTSYTLETSLGTERRRYFLRRYKASIKEEELLFEHSVIENLVAKGFPFAARVLKTRDGKSYLQRFTDPEQKERAFYAIFEFLPGEDRYTWIDPQCTPAEVISSAQILARFHHALHDLKPAGRRAEPAIADLLPAIAGNALQCRSRSKGNAFDLRLEQGLERVLLSIEQTLQVLSRPAYQELPRLVIHCDYHPGNLKFQGDQATGLFDFDWSKVDTRVFDLGLAIWYFFTCWAGERDGELRLDDTALFLEAYQRTLAALPGELSLSATERTYLPVMVNAGNLYVLNWTIIDYYQKEVDPEQYLVFLQHSLRFLEWFENPVNKEKIGSIVTDIGVL